MVSSISEFLRAQFAAPASILDQARARVVIITAQIQLVVTFIGLHGVEMNIQGLGVIYFLNIDNGSTNCTGDEYTSSDPAQAQA